MASFAKSLFSITIISSLVLFNSISQAVPVPYTSDRHILSRDRIECFPASVSDIATFLLLNFGAHAVSIKSYPGTGTSTTIKWALAALLLPYTGIIRGCVAIARGRKPGESSLQRAARAGALAYVSRARSWRPRPGETIAGAGLWTTFDLHQRPPTLHGGVFHLWQADKNRLDTLSGEEVVHGQVDPVLGELGYELRRVQAHHVVEPLNKGIDVELGNDPAWTKAVAAIVQLGSACWSLYQSRGGQLASFGYAAYGLTVIPYATMSLVNLIATAVNADYPAIYLVKTEVMKEAKRRGAKFSSTVGRIPSSGGGHSLHVLDTGADAVGAHKGGLTFSPISLDAMPELHAYIVDGRDGRDFDSTISRRLPEHDGFLRDAEAPVQVEIPCAGRLQCRWDSSRGKARNPVSRFFADFSTRHWVSFALGLVALALPFVLMGLLTHGFRPGSISTRAQRAFMATWWSFGALGGVLAGSLLHLTPDSAWALRKRAIPMYVVMCAPAVAGFVIVIQQMLTIGACTTVG